MLNETKVDAQPLHEILENKYPGKPPPLCPVSYYSTAIMRTGIQALAPALALFVAFYTSIGAHTTETSIVLNVVLPASELKPSDMDNLLSPRGFTRRQGSVYSEPGARSETICHD